MLYAGSGTICIDIVGSLFIVAPIVWGLFWLLFSYAVRSVLFSFAIILMGKRELVGCLMRRSVLRRLS